MVGAIEEKARLAARAALGKKAEGMVMLDVRTVSTIADCFLICCGNSSTQVSTIVDAVETALEGDGHRILHREGVPGSGWVLLDAGDLVVHVFLPETRDFYALERLWGDAPELSLDA